MSSQIKVILKDTETGGLWTGSQAIATALQKYIAPNILKIKFPPEWTELIKIKKLRFLMEYAPKTLKLTVIQQPRGIKPSKSLYHKLKNEQQPDVIGALGRQAVPVQQGRVRAANPNIPPAMAMNQAMDVDERPRWHIVEDEEL